jgi:hypothetical protein
MNTFLRINNLLDLIEVKLELEYPTSLGRFIPLNISP